MDREDFFYDGMDDKITQFEKKLQSGEPFFYDTDELEEIIEYYLDFNQYSKANAAINYGLTLYPYELFYQIKQAQILLANKDINSAIEIMEQTKKKDPNNSDIAKTLGDCYVAGLKYKKAIDCYQFALKNGGDADDCLLRLAQVNFLLGNTKKAMGHISRVSKEYYADEFAIHETMKLFFDFSYAEGGIELLNRIIDEEPYNYHAWYYLGLTYQKLNKQEEAISAFEYCIAIDEKNSLGYLGRGTCLMELDQHKEAIESFKQALEHQFTDAEILCNIAECYENLENFTWAKYYYLKAIKQDKYLSDAFFGLALVYKKLNRLRDAEKNLLKAIDLDEFESMYHVELAEVYLLVDNKDKCIKHYSKAQEIDADTAEITLDYAHAHFEFDEVETSIMLLKKAVEQGHEDYRILYRISSYLFFAGHYEQGFNYLHLALEKNSIEYFLLYEYAPFLENNETVSNIIDLYLQN